MRTSVLPGVVVRKKQMLKTEIWKKNIRFYGREILVSFRPAELLLILSIISLLHVEVIDGSKKRVNLQIGRF